MPLALPCPLCFPGQVPALLCGEVADEGAEYAYTAIPMAVHTARHLCMALWPRHAPSMAHPKSGHC